MPVSRTTNPLHFEDLEPHRFEDLVRQLSYDLKNWKSIEATGRLGGDDGFDVRAIEKNSVLVEDDDIESVPEFRTWLIQCKREKRIAPKKLEGYVIDCLSNQEEKIYGFIIAAACDFSKKARDSFISKLREYDVKEYIIWGKAELEDMLFQPKNDHLLFAYFQISLQVNRRTAKTKIRSRLAMKKKAISILGDVGSFCGDMVLIRDPDENNYPYPDEVEEFDKYPTWIVCEFKGHYHYGIKFLARKYYAYIDDTGNKFDMARAYDDANPFDNPWPQSIHSRELRNELLEFWSKIPEKNRGWIEIIGCIPYDSIIAIDEEGDESFEGPQVYAPFCRKEGPFEEDYFVSLYSSEKRSEVEFPELENRIESFPEKYRERQ